MHITFFSATTGNRTATFSCDAEDYNKHIRNSITKWGIDRHGYLRTKRNKKTVLFHRLVLAANYGSDVDHINGDVSNNEKSNLRYGGYNGNWTNKMKYAGGTSKFKGVNYHAINRKWIAQIRYRGKGIYLGSFSSPEEAAKIYDNKARELFGDYATFNFPLEGERSAL